MPQVVRNETQWQAVLASGKSTPLDALTPYGKTRFIASLQWRKNGLGGFEVLPLIRELNAEQLSAVLTFLDSASYFQFLRDKLTGATLRLPAPAAHLQQRLLDLEQFATLETQRRTGIASSSTAPGATALLRRYEEQFGDLAKPAALPRQALEALPLMFDAADLVGARNPGSSALADMLQIHREMAARGIDTRRSFDGAILRALIAARQFDQARAFADSHPPLASTAIPKVIDRLGPGFKGRSLFHFDSTSNALTRQAAPYSAGAELVMVVAGGCHFSRDALAALREDAQFQARLTKVKLILVTPPRSAIDTEFLASWNAANPSMPIHAPFNLQEWQSIDVAGVPEFFLVKNGKVTGKMESGWPPGGNTAALFELMDSAGK